MTTVEQEHAQAPTIVVAVDDTEPTTSTDLRVAANEARRLGAGIRVVHGCATLSPAGIIGTSVTDERLRYGQYLLTQAVEVLHRLTGGEVHVTTVNSPDLDADAVLAESNADTLLIVIATHTSLGLAADSTAATVAAHARCPVLVLHPDQDETSGAVVVAADNLGNGADLLRLAGAEAVRRGLPLTVVQAWQLPPDDWHNPSALGHAASDAVIEDIASGELAVAVMEVMDAFPDLVVTSRLIRGPAIDVLVAASEGAAVMIVGRPPTPIAGPALSGATEALIARVRCPLLVVQPGRVPVQTFA